MGPRCHLVWIWWPDLGERGVGLRDGYRWDGVQEGPEANLRGGCEGGHIPQVPQRSSQEVVHQDDADRRQLCRVESRGGTATDRGPQPGGGSLLAFL